MGLKGLQYIKLNTNMYDRCSEHARCWNCHELWDGGMCEEGVYYEFLYSGRYFSIWHFESYIFVNIKPAKVQHYFFQSSSVRVSSHFIYTDMFASYQCLLTSRYVWHMRRAGNGIHICACVMCTQVVWPHSKNTQLCVPYRFVLGIRIKVSPHLSLLSFNNVTTIRQIKNLAEQLHKLEPVFSHSSQ